MKKEIDYYGEEDNYIHLKFGRAMKRFNFTEKFRKDHEDFSEKYIKYWNEEEGGFESVEELVEEVYQNKIPVHFYFNFTDTPAESKEEIMEWLEDNN